MNPEAQLNELEMWLDGHPDHKAHFRRLIRKHIVQTVPSVRSAGSWKIRMVIGDFPPRLLGEKPYWTNKAGERLTPGKALYDSRSKDVTYHPSTHRIEVSLTWALAWVRSRIE